MSDEQDGCEWVNISSGISLPGCVSEKSEIVGEGETFQVKLSCSLQVFDCCGPCINLFSAY